MEGACVVVPASSDAEFVTWVKDAVMEGPPGEARLVSALLELTVGQAQTVAAALGDAQGDLGIPALRQLLADRSAAIDLRCATLLAVAKRDGADASDVLASNLEHRDESVRDYAMHALAVVGDDRAWPAVFAALATILDRPAPVLRMPMLSMSAAMAASVALTYLVRHLGGHPDRKRQLLVRLRAAFDRLYPAEREFLALHWPDCRPSGPQVADVADPDARPFIAWARDPLFGPVF